MSIKLKKGQVIYIDDIKYVVQNMTEYNQKEWIWQEYGIRQEDGKEKWLSVENDEYTNSTQYTLYEKSNIYVNTSDIDITIKGKNYTLKESGCARVKDYFGNADVDVGEELNFYDYVDDNQREIISVENWDGEKETTIGKIIDSSRINITEQIENVYNSEKRRNKYILLRVIFIGMFVFLLIKGAIIDYINISVSNSKNISDYLLKSTSYIYVTSVTNNINNEKSNVYMSNYSTIDETVKDLIKGVDGSVKSVVEDSSSDDLNNKNSIGIKTSKEYAYVYNEDGTIYVQVSSLKYVENNGGGTYHSGHSGLYYRTYTRGTSNTTYNSYASSARQSSVNSRTSSGGGTSSGK